MNKIFREPFLHFMIAGAALFLFRGYYGDVDSSERSITIDEEQVSRLADQWQQQWRRPPIPAELDGLIRDHIKEEVYVREAMRLGLDADDPIIRRRLRSKMEFLATAEVENAEPADVELKRYYNANKARYAADEAYSFDQRYYGEDENAARAALAVLNSGQSSPTRLLPVPGNMDNARSDEIARTFGDGFMASLRSLPTSKWSGPVQSGFGWHAVRIRSIKAAKVPALDEISQQVTNDWRSETALKREAMAYQTLLDGYTIKIAKP